MGPRGEGCHKTAPPFDNEVEGNGSRSGGSRGLRVLKNW